MIFPERKRRHPTINIIPLLDILTMLLLFFVVATTFKQNLPAVRIDLPAVSSTTETVPNVETTLLTFTADLQLFLDDQPISLEELPAALQAKLAQPKKVVLRADRTVPLGEILRLTQTLRGLGIQSLPTLTTTEPSGMPPNQP